MNVNTPSLAFTPFSARAAKRFSAIAFAGFAAFGAATVSAQSSMSPAERPQMQPGTTEQAPSATGGMPSGSVQPNRQPTEQQVSQQFQAADANGDGKLSKEEAKTGMPGVFRNFDRIDTKRQGFVTQEDLMLAMKR